MGEKAALIINTASYERVAYALSIAGMLAALGKEVHVLFTYGGVTRLKKSSLDDIGDETPSWIRGDVKRGVEEETIQKISESLKQFKRLGGRIHVCPAAMAAHKVTRDELVDEASV